jgi:hypothetical protein
MLRRRPRGTPGPRLRPSRRRSSSRVPGSLRSSRLRSSRLCSSSWVPGPQRRRGRPLILVAPGIPILVVSPATLLLSSAAGHRPTGAGVRRATGSATVLLVLLRQHSRLLSERGDVRRGVDQGPAEASVTVARTSVFPGVWSRAVRRRAGARRTVRLDFRQPSSPR